MAVIKHSFDSTVLTFLDGTTPTALQLALLLDGADVAVSGLSEALREIKAYQGRGKLRALRLGGREFPTISLSVMLDEFTNAEAAKAKILDFLLRQAGTDFAAAVSTSKAIGDVFTCDVNFATPAVDEDDTALDVTFEDIAWKWDIAEGEPNKITLNGTMYGGVSGDLEIIVDE